MADQQLIDLLNQGIPAWNEWKAKQPEKQRFDLSGTDFAYISAQLSEIDLTYCDLQECNLSGLTIVRGFFSFANLRGANLSRANLTSAQLTCADLSTAILAGANLTSANLGVANLTSAILSGANLSGADLANVCLNQAILIGADLGRAEILQASLKGTDFSSCIIGLTVFGDVDLSETIGLDQLRYDGLPILDVRSIYWSKGQIPEQFLHAAKLPESFITLIPTLNFEEEDCDAEHDRAI